MKYYLEQNVFDAAIDRIRYLFDEFPNVVCNFSGGKDSTVTLHLALQVAEEKGRLPLKVFFIDQEADRRHDIDKPKDSTREVQLRPGRSIITLTFNASPVPIGYIVKSKPPNSFLGWYSLRGRIFVWNYVQTTPDYRLQDGRKTGNDAL